MLFNAFAYSSTFSMKKYQAMLVEKSLIQKIFNYFFEIMIFCDLVIFFIRTYMLYLLMQQ